MTIELAKLPPVSIRNHVNDRFLAPPSCINRFVAGTFYGQCALGVLLLGFS